MPMLLRSFDALSPRRKRLWRVLRWAVPRRSRWFFEGAPGVRGQLWVAERRMVYEAIRRYQPEIVFETGTWYGGGSTYFVATALHENDRGRLHTCEIDSEFHKAAVASYESILPHLESRVHFHFGSSTELYPKVLESEGRADAVLLDGLQSADHTMNELQMFIPYLVPGSLLICHDWDNEKMESVRPFIEGSKDWRILQTITAPQSVGMCTALYQPDR